MTPSEHRSNPVLRAIRTQLSNAAPSSLPLPTSKGRSIASVKPLTDEFTHRLLAIGASCEVVPDVETAASQIETMSVERNWNSIARSDGELVGRVTELVSERTRVSLAVEDRSTLFGADAGITGVDWGIAETGTLVLASSSERHRLTSLVPPVHIAILAESRLTPTMDVVLEEIASSQQQHQAVTFITGPSRTADIELTLVVGVHGPKELHVIVLLNE